MEYIVIERFDDIETNRMYAVGEKYEGSRIQELSTDNNKIGRPFIQAVEAAPDYREKVAAILESRPTAAKLKAALVELFDLEESEEPAAGEPTATDEGESGNAGTAE